MSEFKNMKFRINSKEEDEKLQKYLFSLGYKWIFGNTYLLPSGLSYNKFLYTTELGIITHSFNNKEYFDKLHYPEYILEELITYELKEVVKEFEQFEVFDRLIEINKKNRIDNCFLSNLQFLKDVCTVTFNCGRQKGHSSYINARFNPETDILIVMNHDMMIQDLYKNIYRKHNNKIHTIKNNDWVRGRDFTKIKNIWIDNISYIQLNDVRKFYELLSVSSLFLKDLTIIGVG